MGGAKDSGATGSDAGFENTQKSKLSKKNQKLVDTSFDERGKVKLDNTKLPPSLSILKEPFKAGTKVNRDFFTDKVLGSKNYKTTSKKDFLNMTVSQQEQIYGDYMKGRQTGNTDAYGNPISGGGGNDNNNQPILTSAAETLPANNMTANNMTTTAPTNAEITQASSTTMSADEILVANKKKGRSQTILNNADGLGNSTANTMKKTLGA